MVLSVPITFSQAKSEETPSDASALTLLQAAKLTSGKKSRLRSAPFGREAAAAQLDQAAPRPQWSVELQVEDIGGTGGFSGFGGSETTLRLSRIFQPSALRSGRLSITAAQEDQLENELIIERLDLMSLLVLPALNRLAGASDVSD